MPKQVEITPEVRDVLERGSWPDEALFELPKGQLDRSLYQAVNKVLVALGGKWNRQRQGHAFTGDGKAKFDEAMSAGVAVDQKRTMEQFFTPPEIADRLVEMAMPSSRDEVLEPSAGAGAIIDALVRGGVHLTQITAVELDPALVADLRTKFGQYYQMVHEGNFLTLPDYGATFDIIVMNPPFGRGADMAHVTHALSILRPGGRLVAIMSPHWTFASDSASAAFRDLVGQHHQTWDSLPDGSFKASGTGVSTGILSITKRSN